MGRFVEGADRSQLTLLPECLEDWVSENNAVHVIDAFVDALDRIGFARAVAKETGRPPIIRRSLSFTSTVLSIGCNPAGP